MFRAASRRRRLLTDVLPEFRTNDYLEWSSPEDMGRIYSQSKVVLNVSIGGDLNMRVFEALMSGALLVTDRIDNGLDDLFVDGTHYVGYGTSEEAIAKIAHFLSHDEERQAIADQGRRLALAKHSYAHRWADMRATMAGARDHPSAVAGGCSRRALRDLYTDVFVMMRKPHRLLDVARRYGPSARIAVLLLAAFGARLKRRLGAAN